MKEQNVNVQKWTGNEKIEWGDTKVEFFIKDEKVLFGNLKVPPNKNTPLDNGHPNGEYIFVRQGSATVTLTGGGRPQIRHEIADGEVDLVADRCHDGQERICVRPGHGLLVERPKIFQAPPAPSDKDQIQSALGSGLTVPRVQALEGIDNLRGGSLALNPARRQDNPKTRLASAEHVEDIADGGARGGGDQTQPLGEPR